MKLSFSTLGCPKWTIDEICAAGKRLGYQGIEIRGIKGEFDLTKIDALSEKNRKATVEKFRDAGLEMVMLGSSCKFTSRDPGDRGANLRDAQAAVDIAHATGTKMIRVFGGRIDEGTEKEDAYSWVVENLQALGDYARSANVTIAVESHDDFTDTEVLRMVLDRIGRENVGVLWDVSNSYRSGTKTIAQCWADLRPYAVHTHFKDSYLEPSERLGYRYCLMGDGDVPNFDAVKILEDANYRGYLSLEWEKAWHPDIDEPEIVFPQYIKKMREYLQKLG